MCNIVVPFVDMLERLFSPQRVTPSGTFTTLLPSDIRAPHDRKPFWWNNKQYCLKVMKSVPLHGA